jgi:hypothetical protein
LHGDLGEIIWAFSHRKAGMVASASATGSCSPSLPLELVPIFLAVAVTVAEAVEKLDFKLFSAVQKTLEGVSSAGLRTVLQWLLPLAVRVQLTLRAANDPVAELLGRTIDATLEGRANGVPIRHWATHPLVVYVASKWIRSSRSTVKGCDPGSSLGHAHPHGGASTSSASFNGCRGKHFPRARRRCSWPPCMC